MLFMAKTLGNYVHILCKLEVQNNPKEEISTITYKKQKTLQHNSCKVSFGSLCWT